MAFLADQTAISAFVFCWFRWMACILDFHLSFDVDPPDSFSVLDYQLSPDQLSIILKPVDTILDLMVELLAFGFCGIAEVSGHFSMGYLEQLFDGAAVAVVLLD